MAIAWSDSVEPNKYAVLDLRISIQEKTKSGLQTGGGAEHP